jgi:hypothetical protein
VRSDSTARQISHLIGDGTNQDRKWRRTTAAATTNRNRATNTAATFVTRSLEKLRVYPNILIGFTTATTTTAAATTVTIIVTTSVTTKVITLSTTSNHLTLETIYVARFAVRFFLRWISWLSIELRNIPTLFHVNPVMRSFTV